MFKTNFVSLHSEFYDTEEIMYPHHKITILIVCISALMISITGCRQVHSLRISADSTKIKVIETMQERGAELRNKSDFQAAIAVHDSCIKMAEAINDTIQMVIALNNQGTNFRRLSAMKEASDYHYRALALCDAYSDTTTYIAKKNLVRTLNGLGNILMSLGNNEAAENAFRRALDGEQKLGSATGQAINLANIGSIKNHVGERDSARIYYNRSMEKNREDKNTVGISLCYTYLGNLDRDAGRMSEALENYRHAYTEGRKTDDVWHWLTPCISLAEIYVDYNAVDSAFYYINVGLDAARQIHSSEHLRDLYGLRSRLEDQQGQTIAALADLKLRVNYNDSVLNEESRTHIQNVRVNYEANRRNNEVRRAEEEAHTSRIIRDIVILSAVIIIILIGIALLLYRRSLQMRHKAEHERAIFYRNVTHQLRTPMTVVLGMVSQLDEHIPEGDDVGHESLAAAQRQSKNLLELIKQLIAAGKEGRAPLLSDSGDVIQTINPADVSRGSVGTTDTQSPVTYHPSPVSDGEPLEAAMQQSILLAEDNDDVAMMICTLLRDKGYNVTRAVDGQEALEMLQTDLPDLLLTDIAMPRMDGLELMRRVRADGSMCHLPIIVASARVEDSERLEGISAGAEVYLTKPFISEELLLRVRKLLEQRERLRRRFTQTIAEAESAVHTEMDSAEQKFINDVNDCIDQNMVSGEVNTAFIAEKLFASVSTVNRRVKNLTGMSAANYIRSRRILLAKRLLATTDKTIGEIETLCGFNTPGHFSRMFKAETGLSPSEFRHKETAR